MPYHTEDAPTVVAMLTTRLDTAALEAELVDQMTQIAAIDAEAAVIARQIDQLQAQRAALVTRSARHDALCIGLRTTITQITGRPLPPELQRQSPVELAPDYDEVPW